MAKCINQVITRNIKAQLNKPLSEPTASNDKPVDQVFYESFIDSINNVTKRINNSDCGSYAQKGIDWATEQLQTQLDKAGGVLDKVSSKVGFDPTSIATSMCVTITNIFRAISTTIKAVAALALVLFKKIDNYKTRLEQALLDFVESIRNCLVSNIVDAKVAINKMVTNVLDFDSLLELMQKCPCVTEIMQSLFGCEEDESGNAISEPIDVYNCIINKYNLNPADILRPINNFIDDALLDNIQTGYNVLQESIKTMMEILIAPFRALVKKYCELLNEKHNVSPVIKFLGSAKCLLQYTTEVNEFGLEYEGMSVIDMINSMDEWTKCFEYICSSVTSDVKLFVQEYRETLRLDAKFWNDVFSIDIYQGCIASRLSGSNTRATAIREIFTKNQDKGKDVFTSVIDTIKQVGEITVEAGLDERTIGEVYSATKYKTAPESEETPVQQGTINYYDGVENDLVSLVNNISNQLDREPYYERLVNLLTWETAYIKSQEHINAINLAVSRWRSGTKPTAYAISPVSNQRIEIPDVAYANPTYVIDNDYDQTTIDSIKSCSNPNRLSGEDRVEYYKRWFTNCTANGN